MSRHVLTDTHLCAVAEVYRMALTEGHPPTQAIAEKYQTAHSTASKWVRKARDAGILGATSKGRSGEKTEATRKMSLVEQVRAAQLPPPATRRSIRKAAGVTLDEIAQEIGELTGDPAVSAVSVLRWEQGKTEPQRDRAIAYRRLLDDLQRAITGGAA